jgi:HEAT repeat protein
MLATLRRTGGVWVPVRLTKSPAIASPMVFGSREICVPDRFVTDLTAAEQRAALAHELGHLARRDQAWLLCALVLECVFFFQPLQRVARRGLRESAEYMADSWAVRLGGGRLSLARCLAEVASWVSTSDEPALAEMVAMAEGGSPLLSRVSRLLERDPEPEPRFGLRAAAVVALIAVAGAFAPAVGGAADHRSIGDHDPATSGQPHVAANLDADMDDADMDLDAAGVSGGAQDYLDVTHWPGKGGSLPDGLRWAGASARDAGVNTWWAAWVTNSRVPRGSGAASDSEPGQWSQLNERGVESLLGVTHDVPRTGGFEDAIVLVRLVAAGDGARIDRLAMRTSGRSMDVRGHVYWLGRLDAPASLGWLRDRYAEEQTPRLREAAVEAIAVHDASAVPAFLRNVIESRADRNLAAQAVEGLEWHPSDETVSFLLETARGDGDLIVRTEAAETLGELDHPGAGVALRNLIRAGDGRVRAEALESLAERGDTALAALLLDIALNDPDVSMRNEAVELMQELPVSVAVPLLERVIAESRDERVVHEAIETLADIGSESAFAVIEALTGHAVPSIRREAMEALLDGPGEASGETLLDIALHDVDSGMRREAVERIAELPSQEAVSLLRRVVFESGDGTAERQAAESLGDVGTIEALAVLDDIIARNPGEDASVQAVESIGENFARELAVPRLTRIAREHPSRRVRSEALDCLAELTGGQ